MRMRTFVLVAALAAVSAPARSQTAATPPVIETTGQGDVQIAPDRARLHIAVQTQAPTAVQASASNARRAKAVIDTLRALGLSQSQISTANYQVTPQTVYANGQAPRVTGYSVSNEIQADVPVDQLGSLIDAGLTKGVDAGVSFEMYSSHEAEAHREALAKAVASARADAEVMAKAAGGRLGSLSSMSTSSPEPRPMFAMAARAPQAQTPISAGEQSINAVVVTRWIFVPNP